MLKKSAITARSALVGCRIETQGADYRAHSGCKNDPFAFGTPGHTQATMMCGTGSDRDKYHYLQGVLDGYWVKEADGKADGEAD